MAVVVTGMLIVIVISAKNYTPTEWIILGFFMVVIAMVGGNYFFGTSVGASLKNVSTNPQVKLDIVNQSGDKNPEGSKGVKQEVFHVPGQYNYTDAKALCRAYGGSLANIKQMEEAYKNGAEWCDYGWSADQMALFPTQTKTWQMFQESETQCGSSANSKCGRPGINGGYTMDLNQLLGANCFGSKPAQKDSVIQPPPFPVNPLDVEAEKYKGNLPNVSAFNYNKWSA